MAKEGWFPRWLKRFLIWILKTIWKIFLICLWGALRLLEVIAGQFALWVKSFIN